MFVGFRSKAVKPDRNPRPALRSKAGWFGDGEGGIETRVRRESALGQIRLAVAVDSDLRTCSSSASSRSLGDGSMRAHRRASGSDVADVPTGDARITAGLAGVTDFAAGWRSRDREGRRSMPRLLRAPVMSGEAHKRGPPLRYDLRAAAGWLRIGKEVSHEDQERIPRRRVLSRSPVNAAKASRPSHR